MEYARAEKQPAGSFFDGRYNQGSLEAPFCFYVIKGADQVSMVDIGYDYTGRCKYLADISGCSNWQPVDKVLAKVDVKPDQVRNIFITHAHFDHIGENLTKFKNAHFYMQRLEYEKWVWALALPDKFAWVKNPVDPQDIEDIGNLIKTDKMTLVNGSLKNVLPGIDLVPALNTHSFGCQYIVINDENGVPSFAFVGDNVYAYRNLMDENGKNKYTPIGFVMGDKVNTLLSIDDLFTLMGRDPRKFLITHEAETWNQFPSQKGPDGLHFAEINLAAGEKSFMDVGQ
jgi:glyoxylase-like metal-dependent hydrolase (beta-lactamase superfamily II)